MAVSRTLLLGFSISASYQLANASPTLIPNRHSERRANTPGQPTKVADNILGGYQEVGRSVVSAQQLFLGSDHQVRENSCVVNT